MAGEIQKLFNQYQKKYPFYTKNAIVDKMFKDGAINSDIAQKIKSGTSLFLIDNSYEINPNKKKSNITEIFGGNFSNKRMPHKPQTHFNRQIENTFQSQTQGDCWLLSDINALNCTEWGKKALYDAILPDKNGGVTIRFKGSPLKQKSFYISSNEIINAKKSGNYAKGDDDMIAFELATEKLSKMIEKVGLGKRVTGFDDQINHKSYISGGGVYDKDGNTIDISTLITGRKDITLSFISNTKVPNKVLENMSQNNKNIAAVCTFNSMHDVMGRDKNDPIHGNHAYAIKNINYGKSVTIIDPYHTDKDITLSWKKFMYDVERITVATKNNLIKTKLESLIPQSLKNEIINSMKDSAKMNDETSQRQKDVKIWEKTFPEVAEILIGFNIPQSDISFKKVNENIKTDFLKNIDFEKIYNVSKMETPFNKRVPTTKNVNKDNVLMLLDIKPDFIQFLDTYKSGWGKGKEKKQLIAPIISALAEKAKEVDINHNIINDFEKKCYKELDAIIYTNETIIQDEVNKMIKLIKSKKN